MEKSKQSLQKSNGKQERSSKPLPPPINSYLYFTSKKKESGDLQGYNAVDYTKALSTEWRATGVKEKYEKEYAQAMIDYWWKVARWMEENKDEALEEMETEETNEDAHSESETPLKAKVADKVKKEDSGRKKKKIEHDDE